MKKNQISQRPEVQAVHPLRPIESKGMKNTLLLIIFLILAVTLILFVYVSFVNKQSSLPSSTTQAPSTVIPQTEEQELNSIDLGSIDADLQDIESDPDLQKF